MFNKGLIQSPLFYISAYLEKNREEYYDRLLAVSRDGDWTGWCEFFLTAVRIDGEENLKKVVDIVALYENMKDKIVSLTKSVYAIKVLDWIFKYPVFSVADFIKRSGVPSFGTGMRLLKGFREKGILDVLVEGGRGKTSILKFSELLRVVEKAG